MDLTSIISSITSILAGGTSGIIFLLLLVSGGLVWLFLDERKINDKLQTKFDDIVTKYHTAEIDSAEAMNKISGVLQEIKTEFRFLKNK